MVSKKVAIAASPFLVLLVAHHLAGEGIGNFSAHVASVCVCGDVLFTLHDLSIVSLALPVAFSRAAMPAHGEESFQQRLLVGCLLGVAALVNKLLLVHGHLSSYGMLLSSQAASYAVALRWRTALQNALVTGLSLAVTYWLVETRHWLLAIRILFGLLLAHCTRQFASLLGRLSLAVLLLAATLGLATAPALVSLLNQCLPAEEITAAYATVSGFLADEIFANSAVEMLIVAANIQIALGYLSIEFLRSVQDRQNSLLTVGQGKALSAHGYALQVKRWVFWVCFPYLLQKAIMTNIQSHAFGRFRHWTERALRLHSFFPGEGHEGTMLKAAASSNFTVEQYADALNGVVEMSFGIISAKLNSLPKLLLLPGVVTAKPWLIVTVAPASIVLDMCKAWVTAHLTAEAERLHRQLLELANKRRRMELHDMKSEGLIQRARASHFAQQQWRQVGDQIEDRGMRLKSIQLLQGVTDQMYRQEILGPVIECTLALLIESNHISGSDLYLYTTVLEHAIDTLLTRQREQATLASIETKVSVLLHLMHQRSALIAQDRPTCKVTSGQALQITSLEYSRGPSFVKIPSLILPLGRVVAVTGANGCGKSTALGFVASCRVGTYAPAGAQLLTKAFLDLPSDDIVEIAQQFYWPMFTSPMEWLLSEKDSGRNPEALRGRARQLMEDFELIAPANLEAASQPGYLDEVREDWYGELSGGERCKVEFIQKVFMRSRCPPLLLIDEAFAPLDPVSSQYLKSRLKVFCQKSLVLVVYHGSERLDDSFFDDELHFSNGTAILQPLHSTD